MSVYFFSQRAGGGGAAALGTARERPSLPAGFDDRHMLEGMDHEEAAWLAGLSRSAAYEWHNRYEEEGIEGLRRPAAPRAATEGRRRLKERLVAGAELERDGVVAFRAIDAQRILKEEFDRGCSLSSTYRLLHRINLSWLAPRPRHPEADATAQTAFSQLCNYNSRSPGRAGTRQASRGVVRI